ncbi:glycosyltransferase family 2 protein [Microbacterium sp.]|uniref:glycosyltransferase family 2 protein n=1 Tax=Microbacterium sp. TaxID=51671 RepID=UPI0039E50657
MGTTPDSAKSIVVSLATFRRPAQLRTILPALIAQAREVGCSARIVVVDNDPAGGAKSLVEQAAGDTALVTYLHEPRPGISAARNAALHNARDDDAIVFIDDDEMPEDGWLNALISYWLTERPTAVAGPVRSIFTRETPDPWVTSSGVFSRRRLATGTVIRGAATNNLLIDLGFLRTHRLSFDDRLGLVGGSDTLLTYQITAAGGVIRWCDDAEVSEVVPESRLTRRWVLRRATRTGASWAHATLEVSTSRQRPLVATKMFATAALRIPEGLARYAYGTIARRPATAARGLIRVASHIGALGRLLKVRIHEYKR